MGPSFGQPRARGRTRETTLLAHSLARALADGHARCTKTCFSRQVPLPGAHADEHARCSRTDFAGTDSRRSKDPKPSPEASCGSRGLSSPQMKGFFCPISWPPTERCGSVCTLCFALFDNFSEMRACCSSTALSPSCRPPPRTPSSPKLLLPEVPDADGRMRPRLHALPTPKTTPEVRASRSISFESPCRPPPRTSEV